MPKKKLVTLEEKFTGSLWGIVAAVKDYQLCWHLNRKFGFELKRVEDIEIMQQKKSKTAVFSFYRHEDDVAKWQVFVLSNKYQGEFLLPEIKQADYFLMIKGETDAALEDEVLDKLKEIPVVQLAVKLIYHQLKSRHNLIVE